MLAIPKSTVCERSNSLEAGRPLDLESEVADSTVPVCWFNDDKELLPQNGWDVQSNGEMKQLIVPSAGLVHSGLYSCEAPDETVHFSVDMKGDCFSE